MLASRAGQYFCPQRDALLKPATGQGPGNNAKAQYVNLLTAFHQFYLEHLKNIFNEYIVIIMELISRNSWILNNGPN